MAEKYNDVVSIIGQEVIRKTWMRVTGSRFLEEAYGIWYCI
jgi:hypothetical protein